MRLSRARQEKDDCRISTAGAPKKKEKKENKRCLHAFPARRPDRKGEGRGGGARERSRRRVLAFESIRSARSIPEADRGGDASSIVTNCLVKEGPYMYKDRPPPPSSFIPPTPFLTKRAVARRDSKHNTRASRRTTERSSIDSPSGISSVPIYLAYPP